MPRRTGREGARFAIVHGGSDATLCPVGPTARTDILAASIRSPSHVTQAALAGADCATIPPDVFQALFKHPLTERGLQQFMADWAGTKQSIL